MEEKGEYSVRLRKNGGMEMHWGEKRRMSEGAEGGRQEKEQKEEFDGRRSTSRSRRQEEERLKWWKKGIGGEER